jgi:hypothetical protein
MSDYKSLPTDDIVAWLRDLAPMIDNISGPSSILEINCAKAMRTAADAIESLQKQLEEARSYGQHKGFCPAWPFSSFYNIGSTCTCGYKAALQQQVEK